MATQPPTTPVQPVPGEPHHELDTGIYGFFRRHQKKLLYTAGLFVLLTFSISGAMVSAVQDWFAEKREMPTIAVGDTRVELTPEDYQYGELIARNAMALPPVMPGLDPGEGGQNDLADVLAWLRCAARAEGIDVSMAEVDRAIEVVREQSKLTSAAQLAAQRGMSSLAMYRDLVREAMRIGTYVRLQTLALDTSDARVLQQVIADKEKITLRVASFDEKALEESLKAAGGLTDEDLRKWLDGKTDADKSRIQAYDTNRVELRFGAAMLAEFDAAEWQEAALKDFTVGDEQLKKTYEMEKEIRFKLEGDKKYKPFEDEAVKAELTKLIQAEQVMNHLLGKLREQLNTELQPANEELRKNSDEFFTTQNDLNALTQKLGEVKTKAGENPEGERKAEVEAAQEAVRLKQEELTAKENAKKAAEEAIKTARAAFDFGKAFGELTKDKKGFVQKALTGKRNGDELKDLEAGDLGFGEWPQAVFATYLQNKGDLANMPGRTTKAVVLYQVTDVEVRPLKPWDKLKPLLEGAYFTEKAKTEAEAKKKTMEEALLRLAKAKMPEKVAEIEGKRTADVDQKLAEWEKKTQEGIAEAEKTLAKPVLGDQARAAWQRKLDTLKADLAKKDDKRKEIDVEVGKKIEADIAEAAKKFYGEVLDAAAAEAGFTVAEIGPHSRELSQRPRFDKAFDPTVVYLFQNHAQLKAGEATGVVEDKTNRRWHAAACTKVEPLTIADVERRDFELLRTGYGFASFADQQAYMSYRQAFTREALEIRLDYKSPVGQQSVPTEQKVDKK